MTAIMNETGGEVPLLQAMAKKLEKKGEVNDADIVAKSAEEIALSSELLVDVAWNTWLDKTLYEFAHKMLVDDELPLRPAVDIHRYQLAGACRAALDRFVPRNGIVRRFLHTLTQVMDHINYSYGVSNILQRYSNQIAAFPILERFLRLSMVRARFLTSENMEEILESLAEGWQLTTQQGPAEMSLYLASRESQQEWCFNPTSTITTGEHAMDSNTKEALHLCIEHKRPVFVGEAEKIVLAIPVPSFFTSVLCIKVNRRDLEGDFSEAYLIHWMRFLKGVCPVLAAFGGYAAAQKLLAFGSRKSNAVQDEKKKYVPRIAKHKMFLVPSAGLLGVGAGHIFHNKGQIDLEQIADLSDRCTDLARHIGREEFGSKLHAIATHLKNLLGELEAFDSALDRSVDDERIEVTSDLAHLGIPFELYPFRDSFLYLHRPIVRRLISPASIPPDVRMPFAALLRDLVRNQQDLRVLVMASDPYGELRNVDSEADLVEKAIYKGCNTRGIACGLVKLLSRNNVEDLKAALTASAPFHIFHYCGHSEHKTTGEGATLTVRARDNSAVQLTAKQIRLWFERKGISFAFLNSCEGNSPIQASHSRELHLGLVETLLGAGIPNILSYRCSVSSLGARELACRFYEYLFKDRPGDISHALYLARKDAETIPETRDASVFSLFVSQLP